VYIDTMTQDPVVELQKLGGAVVILSTVTSADALEAVLAGLGPNGKLIINGVPERAMGLSTIQMILNRQAVVGWPSGTGMDSEDTLKFSALSGVKPMVETYPLEKAPEAYERMMSGKARFRVVLTMSGQ
jgi:D-arabinose 1-dehydrogenase-like Zn-dependent alcohol dehydrogenase